ncbi:MAG: hypothetical protein DMF72_01340 [Acidobacteria bacterium]|nr:MAG: hypothetical protein DMF72_01340 [Acidobacteriota bacterium]
MKRVLFLGLLLLVCTFATAQKVQSPLPQLDAAMLDKLAAIPSLDEAVLQIAAEKLRQEKKPMATVDVQITVRLKILPNGCTQECVYYGSSSTPRACTRLICNYPD